VSATAIAGTPVPEPPTGILLFSGLTLLIWGFLRGR
jgi:hypothetical protein